jgi:hypothetical protein
VTSDWADVTATAMDPAWVVFDAGRPGTIAHRLGGGWWCRRCFASSVAEDHVCQDITNHSRRFVRADLRPVGEEDQ